MAYLRQSVSWWCFVPDKITPEKLIAAVAEIGYDALELVDPQYWQTVKDHGLNIASMSSHKILDGLNSRENFPRLEQEIAGNIQLATHWGIPNVICFSGNRNGLSDEAGAEITAENLSRLATMAEEAGVTLTLELLNSKVDHPDYQCDHTAWGVKVCQIVNSSHVKLLYDIYHMQVMEGDVIRNIRDYHEHIGHYHTAGNPGRNEIDDSQELNYRAIAQAIAATGYTGYIGQEFIPTGDPVAGLKQAFDICNVEAKTAK